MIDTVPFELCFQWFTVCSYGPNILRPSAPLLHAEHALPQTGPKQQDCGRSGVNLYDVAQGCRGEESWEDLARSLPDSVYAQHSRCSVRASQVPQSHLAFGQVARLYKGAVSGCKPFFFRMATLDVQQPVIPYLPIRISRTRLACHARIEKRRCGTASSISGRRPLILKGVSSELLTYPPKSLGTPRI